MILFVENKVFLYWKSCYLLFLFFLFFYFCEQGFNQGCMVQEMSEVSGLVWNVWRPANLGPAYLELEKLVLGYPDSVCLETARVWYPQTILGHPGMSHRVDEFHQECLAGCLCTTHLPCHRQWLVAKRKATSDPHVLLELYRLTHDEARQLLDS